MSKEKNFLSAVIYIHNAEQQIGSFLRMVLSVMEENFERSEIICVDDCSDDNSISVIKEISKEAVTSSVSVIYMSRYHGLEASMGAGISLSIGDFVMEFDTTMQDFGQEKVVEAYQRALEGYDIVGVVPKRKQKLGQKLFYCLMNGAACPAHVMQTESFRILSRRAVNRTGVMNRTVPYRKAVYANCGLPASSICYTPMDMRVRIKDRQERVYRLGLAVDALILFTDIGYRMALRITMLMMLVALFMAVYSVGVYASSTPVEGWMTTVLFLSAAFFGLFGILTVIIKYLQIIVGLVFRKKDSSYSMVEKLTK